MEFGVCVQGSWFGVWFRAHGLESRVCSLGFGVGFGIKGSGLGIPAVLSLGIRRSIELKSAYVSLRANLVSGFGFWGFDF